DQIMTRIAGGAGLQAVGSLIAEKEAIDGWQIAVGEPHASGAKKMVVHWVVFPERFRQQRHVSCTRGLSSGREARLDHEVALPHAEVLRFPVHCLDESVLTAAHCLCQYHRRVVAGLSDYCENGVLH